jgi:hypothetical protein
MRACTVYLKSRVSGISAPVSTSWSARSFRRTYRHGLLRLDSSAQLRLSLGVTARANRHDMGTKRRRNTHEGSQLDVLGLRRLQLRDRRLRDAEPVGQLLLAGTCPVEADVIPLSLNPRV